MPGIFLCQALQFAGLVRICVPCLIMYNNLRKLKRA
nr:MAG TPA: hypothetical protein [Caudoviricetes sp.]